METAFSSLQIFSFPSKLEGLKIHPLVISRKDAKAAPQLGRAELSMFPLRHVPACVLGEGENPSQTPPACKSATASVPMEGTMGLGAAVAVDRPQGSQHLKGPQRIGVPWPRVAPGAQLP